MLIALWKDVCFYLCVCVLASVCSRGPPLLLNLKYGVLLCTCRTRVWRRGPPDRLLLPIECSWQVCCGGGLCNVNKQQQQQQQLRWLPPSLSHVVIRSGWKCGTTAPLTINQTFLPGGGLQTETGCGRLSPLSACHMSPLLWPLIPVLSSATGHLGLHPRCVIRSPSTAQVTHPLCKCACECVSVCVCAIFFCFFILQSVLPPTGRAPYWQWHFLTLASSPEGP